MRQTPTAANSSTVYLADLELLEKMFLDDFDWEKWWDDPAAEGPEDVIRRVYRWHDYREGSRPVGTVSCGSARIGSSALALYRLLYLMEPSFVDFSDMYKSETLCEVCSPDYAFRCSAQFYKYELGLYFGCRREDVEGQSSMVQGGWPGCDNGVRCKSEIGKKWFGVFVKALTREWLVYSGNDFSV